MTDQELELELNEAGTRLEDPPARSTTCWGFSMKLLYQKGRMTKNKVVDSLLPPDFEAKVAKLTELGFGRDAVIQRFKLFNGNEEQAAGYLFGELVIGKLPLFTAVESLAHFLFLEDMLPVRM
ncbi:hypothetical protein Syun_023411 [Stephania yunnanensis]|uniref:UBA domain-containing protein n=1 Tax=Stephania yunnanensis TaxID=152371 RepID=A0AAP0I3F8_9MAGN